MRSTRRLVPILLGSALLVAGIAPGAAAQDPSESPGVPQTCGVLSAEEVSAAMGVTLTVASGGDADCGFDSDYASGTYLSVYTSIESGDLESIKSIMCSLEATPAATGAPCAIDVQIAGQAGVYLADAMGTLLYVQYASGALFDIQLVGETAETVDRQAALSKLAEVALPRISGMSLPTQQPVTPERSYTPDPDLEALIPTQVGGMPVAIQSMSGNDLANDGEVPDTLTQALASQGKTIEDVSIATAYYVDSTTGNTSVITALRVKGANMVELTAVLVPLLLNGETPASQTTVQIGGKDVTVIKETADDTDEQAQYVYARNDILWVVQAAEPGRTEIFAGLP